MGLGLERMISTEQLSCSLHFAMLGEGIVSRRLRVDSSPIVGLDEREYVDCNIFLDGDVKLNPMVILHVQFPVSEMRHASVVKQARRDQSGNAELSIRIA